MELGVGVAFSALALSGCGGGTTTTASSTARSRASSTTGQFVARASRICGRVSREQKALKTSEESLKGLPVDSADKQFVSLARRAAAIARAADGRLRSLPRPPADSSTIQSLVQAYAQESSDAETIASAVAKQESELGEAASSALARSIRLESAGAKRLGMGGCFAE